jgi:hypothetical protein
MFICTDGSLAGPREKSLMSVRSIALAALILLASTTPVDAGLIFKGVDASIVAGSTGVVEFTIESDGNSLEPDLSPNDFLAFYASAFRITTVSSAGGRLEFASAMVPPLGDTAYVFDGTSFNQITGTVFNPSQTLVPNDTLSIVDASVAPAVLMPGSDKLLARLPLTALGALPPQMGDTFDVTMTPQAFIGPLGPNLINIGQSDLTARVTITASTAVVPEPASALIWAMVCLLGFVGQCRRQRSSHMRSCPELAVST